LLDDIKELVASQSDSGRPKILYHYTSQDAAKSILAGNAIWATDVRFLNDSSEYSHGMATAFAVAMLAQINATGFYREVLEAATRRLVPYDPPKLYVSSFSTDGDSRSQWGLYCPAEDGVAIGFDHESLRRFATVGPAYPSTPRRSPSGAPLSARLDPCVYAERTQQKLVAQFLNRVSAAAEAGPPPSAEEFADDILRTASTFAAVLKHPMFVDEKEWRLVEVNVPAGRVKTRMRRGLSVEYIEVPLGTGPAELPVAELVVGPQRSLGVAVETWEEWLSAKGLGKIPVLGSDVPLVNL
jgi:hypothetical protein